VKAGILKPDHFGDLILAAPAIAALRRRFADLTLFCHPNSISLASHLFPGLPTTPVLFPAQDKERSLDSHDFSRVRATLHHAVDLLVCLRWEPYIEEVLLQLGVDFRSPRLVTNAVHAAVEQYGVVAPLTGPYDLLSSYSHPMSPGPAQRPMEVNRVGLCIAAGFPLNAWPLSHWLELAGRLHQRDFQVVLIGGPAEVFRLRILADTVADSLGYSPQVVVGSSDYQSFLDTLAGSTDLIIATDSGTAHFAALVRPVLSLFGGSPWRRFAPLGRFNVVLTRDMDCAPCYQFMRDVVNLCHTQECLANLFPKQVEACLDAYLANTDPIQRTEINGVRMIQAPWLDCLAAAA
jgi:heptosyltransferase-2